MNNASLEKFASLVSDKYQELIILPTEKCNFRCTYCYEDFLIGRMKKETKEAIKKLIDKRVPDLEYLYISWFGGEPLLAKDIVLDISRYANSYSQIHSSYRFDSGITTNGYLLDDKTLNELLSVNVRNFQITLDGPAEIHDKSRVKASGGKTFDKIWENLLNMKNSDLNFTVLLRIHYDTKTIYSMETLLLDLKREFISDKRFKIHPHEIERLGGPNDHLIQILTDDENKKATEFINFTLYENNYVEPYEEPYICYASKPNSLLIRADGKIGKCTVALNDDRNNIGNINEDGTLTLNQNKIKPWIRGIYEMDHEILKCPLSGLS